MKWWSVDLQTHIMDGGRVTSTGHGETEKPHEMGHSIYMMGRLHKKGQKQRMKSRGKPAIRTNE